MTRYLYSPFTLYALLAFGLLWYNWRTERRIKAYQQNIEAYHNTVGFSYRIAENNMRENYYFTVIYNHDFGKPTEAWLPKLDSIREKYFHLNSYKYQDMSCLRKKLPLLRAIQEEIPYYQRMADAVQALRDKSKYALLPVIDVWPNIAAGDSCKIYVCGLEYLLNPLESSAFVDGKPIPIEQGLGLYHFVKRKPVEKIEISMSGKSHDGSELSEKRIIEF
jgi:hypothetical protein